MKKSLLISDEEKYGASSPTVAMDAPSGKGGKDKAKPKTGISIQLTGSQVDAFCACSLKVGDSGQATVHYVVKSVSQGESYGSEVPTKDSPQKVSLVLTDVEAEDGGEESEEDESKEDPKEEAAETPEEEDAEEKDEPAGEPQEKVSPKDAGLED
jgi:hypothetical protein